MGRGLWWVSAVEKTQNSSLHLSTTSNSRYGLERVSGGGDCGGCLLWIRPRVVVYILVQQATSGMVIGM